MCADLTAGKLRKYTNPRGGQFRAGIYPVSANVLFGKDVAALPDGRLAKEPLADGVSPRQVKTPLAQPPQPTQLPNWITLSPPTVRSIIRNSCRLLWLARTVCATSAA